jgi:hypothetical protein
MPHQIIAFFLCALATLFVWPNSATAEMGPCRPLGGAVMFCGSGDRAARTFYKTTSPSGRLAFGWRLTDRPPTLVPEENDPSLENIVVRIGDGAVLAKSHGSYWDLGTKIAKAHVFAAWSPDSHLAVKIEQRAESASAEFFAFTEHDTALGPFELVQVIKPAVLAEMKTQSASDDYALVFSSHPEMTIDNEGLVHICLQAVSENGPDSPIYETIVQLHAAGSLSANVKSIKVYPKAAIFITVH